MASAERGETRHDPAYRAVYRAANGAANSGEREVFL
jgi:hypothetical protein